MENATGEVGWPRQVGDYFRRWQWQVGAAAAIMVVLAVGWIGYRSSPTFVGDFAANFVADAIVAVVAFAVATVAFGLRERQKQQSEALEKLIALVQYEIYDNQVQLIRIEVGLIDGGPSIRTEVLQRPLKFSTTNCELFLQSPLVAYLPVDVLRALQQHYSQCNALAEAIDFEEIVREAPRMSDDQLEHWADTLVSPLIGETIENGEVVMKRLAALLERN